MLGYKVLNATSKITSLISNCRVCYVINVTDLIHTHFYMCYIRLGYVGMLIPFSYRYLHGNGSLPK